MPGIGSSPELAILASQPWDVIVIGGGITGAGVMREAARLGLRVLLVEQNDFASGTSSRSAKLIHGGLHYLPHLHLGLVRESVRERERLIRDGAGLVERQGFILLHDGDRRSDWVTRIGLGVYDLLAHQRPGPRHIDAGTLARDAPGLAPNWSGALAYNEATIDDARLVLCVIRHGCHLGGHALDYVTATDLLRDASGRVNGVRLRDRESGIQVSIRARAVVNATGPWADGLRSQLGALPRLRLVRGSHLIFPRDRLPVSRAVATVNPESNQPVCFIPWEGVTLVGTTSVDDSSSLECGQRISGEETGYLLRAARWLFPRLDLDLADISATFTGVRPIVDDQTRDAARASRDYAIWEEDGLMTVAGGKLTTFHPMAVKAIRKLALSLPDRSRPPRCSPVLEESAALPPDLPFDSLTTQRLFARYGPVGLAAIAAMPAEEHRPMPGLGTLWGELRWAARAERVRHLDDVLLRRLRIGLIAPGGGLAWCQCIRAIVQSELGWCDRRWYQEVERYRQIWHAEYGVPDVSTHSPLERTAVSRPKSER